MCLALQSGMGTFFHPTCGNGRRQPAATAWHVGHTLRLIRARENQLESIVEIDEFYQRGSRRHTKCCPSQLWPGGKG